MLSYRILTPLVIITLIGIVWWQARPMRDPYRSAVLAGLVCSLAGDTLLSNGSGFFLAGLVAFLLAHVAYIVAFTRDGGFTGSPIVTLPLAIAGSWLLTMLLPGLGDMTLPVLLYTLVILTMAMQALERWRRKSHAGAPWAALGAMTFLISQASLGLQRFAGGFTGDTVVISLTYYLAQWLIADSVRRRAGAIVLASRHR